MGNLTKIDNYEAYQKFLNQWELIKVSSDPNNENPNEFYIAEVDGQNWELVIEKDVTHPYVFIHDSGYKDNNTFQYVYRYDIHNMCWQLETIEPPNEDYCVDVDCSWIDNPKKNNVRLFKDVLEHFKFVPNGLVDEIIYLAQKRKEKGLLH